MLCTALNIIVEPLKSSLSVLKDISPKVIELINDKDLPTYTFRPLKKMVPLRQIECANLIIKLEKNPALFWHIYITIYLQSIL
ncbi:histone deacetylase complex regulatory component SIN3 [Kluyvera sp. 1366]|jgi:hypothetical protein